MENDATAIADEIAHKLQQVINSLPEGFYCSFDYTTTGKNLAHPLTLGLLSRILWDLPKVSQVGIDVRLNAGGGVKFQPDVVGFDSECKPIVFVDYESPNSSDARVPYKDIDAYIKWRESSACKTPYVIITTLPNRETPKWELRYTAAGKYNEGYDGRREEIRKNPFHFWYTNYRVELQSRPAAGIVLLNIDHLRVHRCYPEK